MTVSEIGAVTGIIAGLGSLIGVLVRVYRVKPETQTLVMSTGETGVKILDNVIDTLQTELERRTVHERDLERILAERDELFRTMRTDLEECVREVAALRRRGDGEV